MAKRKKTGRNGKPLSNGMQLKDALWFSMQIPPPKAKSKKKAAPKKRKK